MFSHSLAVEVHRAAVLSGMAYREFTDALYLDLAGMGMSPDITFIDAQDTECFICENETHAYLVFRGSNDLQDWVTNLDMTLIDSEQGRVHRGFANALDNAWDRVLDDITGRAPLRRKLVVGGHSQGAALARQAVKRLLDAGVAVEWLFAFAPPRDGDVAHADAMDAMCYDRHYYFVNNNDIVPRVPPRSLGYSHSGQCLYFSEAGELLGRPGWLRQLMDRLDGRFQDLFEPGTDGIKDHGVGHYISLTESLLQELDDVA